MESTEGFHSPCPETPKESLSGAKFYESFMSLDREGSGTRPYSDSYVRRMRKGRSPHPDDAAGLICGSKYHGRVTPLRGKGLAPENNKNDGWTPSKAVVPGRSYFSVTDLLSASSTGHEEESAAVETLSDIPRLHDSYDTRRFCMRVMDQSSKSSIMGSALNIVAEESAARPGRSRGAFAPTINTATRLFIHDQSDEALVEGGMSRWGGAWSSQMKLAEVTPGGPRPQTAPANSRDIRDPLFQTAARRHYHQDVEGHQDVLRYRFSGGICPEEYKFVEVRQSVPQLVLKPQGSAKEVFMDARTSYSVNRVKGLMSSGSYY